MLRTTEIDKERPTSAPLFGGDHRTYVLGDAWMSALDATVRVYRELRGLSREDLAMRAGVRFDTVRHLEDEVALPAPSIVPRLAMALRVQPCELAELAKRVESVDDDLGSQYDEKPILREFWEAEWQSASQNRALRVAISQEYARWRAGRG
jgi:transcriptional regulator with XRE-family HTH domain